MSLLRIRHGDKANTTVELVWVVKVSTGAWWSTLGFIHAAAPAPRNAPQSRVWSMLLHLVYENGLAWEHRRLCAGERINRCHYKKDHSRIKAAVFILEQWVWMEENDSGQVWKSNPRRVTVIKPTFYDSPVLSSMNSHPSPCRERRRWGGGGE